MSKVTFDKQNGKNLIILNESEGAVNELIVSGTFGNFANNSPVTVSLLAGSEITILNNNHLTIADSTVHLSAITAKTGIIDLHNSYIGHELTDITVENSTVNITGNDICIGTLILDQNSTLNFTHNNHNYHIQTQIGVIEDNAPDIIEDNTQIEIQNIDQSLTIYELANDKYKTNTPFAINEIRHIKAYQKLDPNFVNLFTGQNEMADVRTIDKFIGQHYMHYTAVAKDNNLPGSFLEGAGKYNVLAEICSWLDLSAVVFNEPDVVHTDEPGDLDILIGNSNLNQCLFD